MRKAKLTLALTRSSLSGQRKRPGEKEYPYLKWSDIT